MKYNKKKLFNRSYTCWLKAENFRATAKKECGIVATNVEFMKWLEKIDNYGRGKASNLTIHQEQLKDLCERVQISPITAARWFRTCLLSTDLKEKIQNGTVTMRQAINSQQSRVAKEKAILTIELLEECRNIVEGM